MIRIRTKKKATWKPETHMGTQNSVWRRSRKGIAILMEPKVLSKHIIFQLDMILNRKQICFVNYNLS